MSAGRQILHKNKRIGHHLVMNKARVKTHIRPYLLIVESPVAQWLEHPTRSRRALGSNSIWGLDFSEFLVDSIIISFHVACKLYLTVP